MEKLAVIFPGIGYTAEKPLLHYSRRLAESLGYESLILAYGGFPKKVRGDEKKLRKSYELALSQAEELLAPVKLKDYGRIVFIGKSVGAAVAARIGAGSPARERIRYLLYTPLEESFALPLGESLVFTGGADPWVGGEANRIPALCAERNIPCRLIPGANHSLESGDPLRDLQVLQQVMEETAAFLRGMPVLTG